MGHIGNPRANILSQLQRTFTYSDPALGRHWEGIPGPVTAAQEARGPSTGLGPPPSRPLGAPGLGRGWGGQGQAGRGLTSPVLLPLQGSAPILVAMVILLNIGVAILFINFFI